MKVIKLVLLLYLAEFSLGEFDPVIITTWGNTGFVKATERAYWATKLGGRMYGLVEGLSACEELQCDTTVGYGGSPDENGETTLDSLVIDSVGMRIGSVANLHRIKDAARVAWAVMNYTKHTMLVGESATQFAKTVGFTETNLTTDWSKKAHEDWLQNGCQPNFWINVSPDPTSKCGPYKPTTPTPVFLEKVLDVEETNHDTIGMVIIDGDRNTSAGTSSNGARNKIPGRVGDSPIPGAGAYASHAGGAAATGDGDIMMRFLPSFYTVQQMELGSKPTKAALKAIKRILEYYPLFQGAVVAADTKGRVGAACANIQQFKYSVTRNGTVQAVKTPCLPSLSHKKDHVPNTNNHSHNIPSFL